MNKLNYGNFDSTSADIAFSSTNGYIDPASELETRKQLSYPLKEIKDYINNTIPTDTGDNPVQLVVTSNSIGYRTTIGGTVNPIATTSSHSHGNITNAGDITANATIASGDRLIINDESASKVTNSSITFGTSTTSYLANNGTWQTPAKGMIATLLWTNSAPSSTFAGQTITINGIKSHKFIWISCSGYASNGSWFGNLLNPNAGYNQSLIANAVAQSNSDAISRVVTFATNSITFSNNDDSNNMAIPRVIYALD